MLFGVASGTQSTYSTCWLAYLGKRTTQIIYVYIHSYNMLLTDYFYFYSHASLALAVLSLSSSSSSSTKSPSSSPITSLAIRHACAQAEIRTGKAPALRSPSFPMCVCTRCLDAKSVSPQGKTARSEIRNRSSTGDILHMLVSLGLSNHRFQGQSHGPIA